MARACKTVIGCTAFEYSVNIGRVCHHHEYVTAATIAATQGLLLWWCRSLGSAFAGPCARHTSPSLLSSGSSSFFLYQHRASLSWQSSSTSQNCLVPSCKPLTLACCRAHLNTIAVSLLAFPLHSGNSGRGGTTPPSPLSSTKLSAVPYSQSSLLEYILQNLQYASCPSTAVMPQDTQ